MKTVLSLSKWIAMSTNVYVDVINDNLMILYHVNSGIYKIFHNKDFIDIVKMLYAPINLGVISSKLVIDKYSDDIEWALENDIFIPANTVQKPIVLLPLLNLQKDLTKYIDGTFDERLTILGSKQNLISGIYIRIADIQHTIDTEYSTFRTLASKQYPCPSYEKHPNKIPLKVLFSILNSLRHTSISIVDIICTSDYFQSYDKTDFIDVLSKYNYKYRIHFFIEDVETVLSLLDLSKTIKIQLIAYIDKFTTSIRDEYVNSVDKILYLNYDVECSINEYRILPVYVSALDRKNNNVNKYIGKEGILEYKLGFNDIFRNQKLNSNFFGIFDIDTIGNIRAYGSSYIIDTFGSSNFSWTDIVINELKYNHSWRLTRDMTSCKDCPFRFICPPISSYEISSNNTKICI